MVVEFKHQSSRLVILHQILSKIGKHYKIFWKNTPLILLITEMVNSF